MYKEIIVVEGKNDVSKLKAIFNGIECFSTNGSAVEEVLPELINLSKTRDLILFLDPDFPGEKIRNKIVEKIDCKHAFLSRKDAISKNKKKIGIEHATKENIILALENVLTVDSEVNKILIHQIDLYDLNLIGTDKSAKYRNFLTEKLRIGHCNSKQLVKRLNMFNIDLITVKKVLEGQNFENK